MIKSSFKLGNFKGPVKVLELLYTNISSTSRLSKIVHYREKFRTKTTD